MPESTAGLNNAPVCVVRSSFSREYPSAGNKVILKQEADREHMLTRNATSNMSANCHLPKLEGFTRRELGTPQSMTQGCADIPGRIQNNPSSPEKLLKKQFQTSAQPANREGNHVTSLTQPSTPLINLDYSPCIQNNVNSDSSYLDQKIKVLEKLSEILQTDSLTEIQKWFARASKKEKDFVSSLIYSELTDKAVLNSTEGTAENMNSQSLLKPLPTLQKVPGREKNQSRSSAKESVASRNVKQKREKECHLLSRLRNRGPAQANTLLPGKNSN
ncbi:uncharacterized protein C4orf17 homolog isoform X2 [Aquila chrysaetos chrysaetos]|uniref:uncharacterized protein C4orf17 homolog isoform X2 n=1 Tax=Aquila chrysaetos chrysaetos TaxID=223781 RepID=UPI001B7D3945|nr:uncharacterized protein C4orf17 homolog isoform X2 [Aquila chrysaetos chrysaetos]